MPRIPLHPELRVFAVACIENDNMSPQQLAKRCHEWAEDKWGKNYPSGDKSHRYLLAPHDRTSIYRTIAARTGSPSPPNPTLQDSLLYYEPCVEGESDRFVLILSHPEQQEFARSVAHNGQVDFDLTFGFSSARANLLNIVAIDHRDNSGIPIGHIIFTARSTAKAAHADYNTELLTRLLGLFKTRLCDRLNIDFTVCVANTDNDARERAALTMTWDSVHLLLLGDARIATRSDLARFSMRLMKEIKTYPEAIAAYNEILARYQQLEQEPDEISGKQARAGLAYLVYFRGYLKDLPFWKAWSPAGAAEAAEKLGIPLEKVARTTNHVEYFNHLLKGPLFSVFEKGGRRPRLDVWVLTLLTEVLPRFFLNKGQKIQLNDLRQSARILRPSGPSNEEAPEFDKLDDPEEWLSNTIEAVNEDSKAVFCRDEDPETMLLDGYGMPLPIPSDPEHSSPENADDDFDYDYAQESTEILWDLSRDAEAASESEESNIGPLLGIVLPSAQERDARGLTSRQQTIFVTGCSMMQKAEDVLHDAIKMCQLAGWSGFNAEYYRSQSLRDQDDGQAAPLGFAAEDKTIRISMSPPLLLQGEQEPGPSVWKTRVLGTFKRQTKSKRI
ncbi:hypothetical protein EWM64_g8220 [Hericium alpestre]|uniref:Uncharacterized protein n=1 Tax=Hericium alpestre TaxID=135208 RepID=A0A4Y9ZPN8_9AGAM|nr:hypothetical protein EWM64_g8220 [Hericium alpestre]